MNTQTIGFIGLGLIGGSIARTIRRVHPEYTLMAYDLDLDSLSLALADGTINQAHDYLSGAFSDCDIIILCTPVNVNIHYLKQLKPIIKPDCILTDVGSVKSSIHQAVHELDMERWFIGGHPMAGSEKTGYAHASDRLTENVYYILTPTDATPAGQLNRLTELIRSISSIPIVLDAGQHDFITAAISHLPHIIAYTLVNLVKDTEDKQQLMRLLAAGGFKDITRIASSSPTMWQQICFENKENILKVLELYTSSLKAVDTAIQNEDRQYLLNAFSAAADYRDAIPKVHVKTAIGSVYEIYTDLVDESGAIATIATILATNAINIKNIGIVHNREFQEGALHIEFYDEEARQKSIELLQRFHYIVHERS